MSKARLAIVGVLVTVDGRIGKQPAIIPSRRVYVYGKNWPCFLCGGFLRQHTTEPLPRPVQFGTKCSILL